MGDIKTVSVSNIRDMIQEARDLYEDGKYAESLNIYNNIINIDENNVNALYSIGVIKAHQKENNVAIEFFEKVNNIMPNHPPTVANLSYLLEKERPKEAAEYARIALITFPDMNDLKRRLGEDRRFFSYFHPALEDEPIIFVQVALTKGLGKSIQEIMKPSVEGEKKYDTATFYSISNCQEGLARVTLGHFLIKRVLYEIHEFHKVLF